MSDLFGMFADRPIAFNRWFARICGSVDAGLFLSQAVYWSLRSSTGDMWFWKTADEWEEETTIKVDRQASIRKQLVKMGFLEEVHRRIEHRIYFRVLVENIINAISLINHPNPESVPSRMANRSIADSGIGPEPNRTNIDYSHRVLSESEKTDLATQEENHPEPEPHHPNSQNTQSTETGTVCVNPERSNESARKNKPCAAAGAGWAADVFREFCKSTGNPGVTITPSQEAELFRKAAKSELTKERFMAVLKKADADSFFDKNIGSVGWLINNWDNFVRWGLKRVDGVSIAAEQEGF